MYELFAGVMEAKGWEVILCPLNYNMEHYERYLLLLRILSENQAREYYVRMHPVDFKGAMASMMFTPIKADYTKDKSSEKKGGVEQENATHLGDTVDYYLIWKHQGGMFWSDSGFDIEYY